MSGLSGLVPSIQTFSDEPEDPAQDLFNHTYISKPNDFSDLSEHFVPKVSLSNKIKCWLKTEAIDIFSESN